MSPRNKLVIVHPVHGYRIKPQEDLKTIKFIGARVDADWCLSSQVLGKWRNTGINMVELLEQSWK